MGFRVGWVSFGWVLIGYVSTGFVDSGYKDSVYPAFDVIERFPSKAHSAVGLGLTQFCHWKQA